MIILQLALFCAFFTLMVKLGVGENALNGLYFYPKPVQERAYEIGLTDPDCWLPPKAKPFIRGDCPKTLRRGSYS